MKELIKISKEKETLALKEFFQTVPHLKLDWENLQTTLLDNTSNLLMISENIELTNETFRSALEKHLEEKERLLNEIKDAFSHNINNIKADNKDQKKQAKSEFFTEQKHIKNELLKIEIAHQDFSSSLSEDILKIEENYQSEKDLLDDNIEEEKKVYLNRVSSIYKHKENEVERIDNKYHEQIKDYYQKNRQRLTQNSHRLSEEDEALKNYLEFHEKDTIYAKQNYFRTVTNLNNKINSLAQTYKALEKEHDENFLKEKENILKYLEKKSEELQQLSEETLNKFEKKYQEIDSELDLIREDYHEIENTLKNKYNREVTSINVELHNAKEEINELLFSFEAKKIEDEQNLPFYNEQIKELNKKLNHFEKVTNKKLKEAKRRYRAELIREAKNYVSLYESTLYKRTLAEQDKNDTINYYREVFLLDEEKTAEKTKINKIKATIKKDIVELYKQLEIIPLESQSSLAALIYNLEVNLQKLENDYMSSLTKKKKDLLNLKSDLHKHNLNKTRDRINANHQSELSISNLTNYLQMESEKNELVHLKRSVILQKKEFDALSKRETLKIMHQQALSETEKGFKVSIFNAHLENKMALKNLNEKILLKQNNYLIDKERFLKQHLYNQVEAEDFVNSLEFEGVFLNDLISDYNNLLLSLMREENEILISFTANSLGNTNEDDFKVFLTKTKELLLLKHNLIKDLINKIILTINSYLNDKIHTLKEEKLKKTESKIYKTFDSELEKANSEKKFLEKEILKVKEKISAIDLEVASLHEQRKYALETLVYSEKELHNLTKQKTSSRNKRLIDNLNDHIKINSNLASKRKAEIKALNNNLKEHKKTISNFNKQIRKIDSKFSRIEKNKKTSLKRLKKSLGSETLIFKKLLDKLKRVNNTINNKCEFYFNSVDGSLFNDKTVKKTIKSLNVTLKRKQNLLKGFLQETLKSINLQSKNILKRHSRNREKQIKYQNKSLSSLAKNHLSNISKLEKKIKVENKKAKNKEASILKLQKRVLKKLLNDQEREIELQDEIIKEIIAERINFHQKYKQINKAFEINRTELLLKERENLKENLRNSLRSNQGYIKETKRNINKLNAEIEFDKKKHLAQLNYFINEDKQARKKLHKKQSNNINRINKEIDNLKKRLPKLDQEINLLVDNRKIDEQRLKRKIQRTSYFTNFINNIKLRFSIVKEKRIIKNEILKDLSIKK